MARNPDKLTTATASLPGRGHCTLAAHLSTPAGMALVATHLNENHYDVFVNLISQYTPAPTS